LDLKKCMFFELETLQVRFPEEAIEDAWKDLDL
jgi:hypothetical protein